MSTETITFSTGSNTVTINRNELTLRQYYRIRNERRGVV